MFSKKKGLLIVFFLVFLSVSVSAFSFWPFSPTNDYIILDRTLSDLNQSGDVNYNNPVNGQCFRWSSSQNAWINQDCPSGGGGGAGGSVLAEDVNSGTFGANQTPGGDYVFPNDLNIQGDLVFPNANSNIIDLGNITFQTGATGGTIRTGTSNADTWELQAYDVDGGVYQKIAQGEANNTPRFELYTGSLEIHDTTDEAKTFVFDASSITSGQTRTLTVQDASGTLAYTTDLIPDTNAQTACDGNTFLNGDGQCTAAGGGGSTNPAGSDTQIQFNDGGSFGGDSDFTWDKTNNNLVVTGDVNSDRFWASGGGTTLLQNNLLISNGLDLQSRISTLDLIHGSGSFLRIFEDATENYRIGGANFHPRGNQDLGLSSQEWGTLYSQNGVFSQDVNAATYKSVENDYGLKIGDASQKRNHYVGSAAWGESSYSGYNLYYSGSNNINQVANWRYGVNESFGGLWQFKGDTGELLYKVTPEGGASAVDTAPASWVEALTIDSTGNVDIGAGNLDVSEPGAQLTIGTVDANTSEDAALEFLVPGDTTGVNMELPDNITKPGFLFTFGSGTQEKVFQGRISGDTVARISLELSAVRFGAGNAARDVHLLRTGANSGALASGSGVTNALTWDGAQDVTIPNGDFTVSAGQTVLDSASTSSPLRVNHTGDVPLNAIQLGDIDDITSNTGIYCRTQGNCTIRTASLATLGLYADPNNNEGLTIQSDGRVTVEQGITDSIQLPVSSAKVSHLTNPATLDGSEARFQILFDANDEADFTFTVPETFDDDFTLSLKIKYAMTSATTGTQAWQGSLWCTSNNESAQTESFDTVNSTTPTVPGSAGNTDFVTLTMTNNDSMAVDDVCTLRVKDNGGTASGQAELLGLTMEWTT